MIEKIKAYILRINPRSPKVIAALFSFVLIILILGALSVRDQENRLVKTQQNNPGAYVTPLPTPTLTPGKDYVEGQINIKFKSGLTDTEINNNLLKYNARIKSTISGINTKVISVPAGSEETVRKQLIRDGIVEYAELDFKARAQFTPNDTNFANQWGLSNAGQAIEGYVGKPISGKAGADIHVKEAWDVTKGNGVKVAVLDTGIDINHPDFSGKIADQKIFATASIDDKFSHGTHTAGIVAANTNNGQGVAGTCPDCKLMIGKVLDDTGSGAYSGIADGITWAADNGAKVISMSLAGQSSAKVLEDAVSYAWGKGAVLVAAAGNCGDNNYSANGCSMVNPKEYPAALPNVVSVGATDSNDQHWSLSNNGTWVNVAAPGFHIFSTFPTHSVSGQTYFDNNGKPPLNYGFDSGTSMAAPMVSGVVGLIWSTSHGTSNQAVVDRLFSTADQISGTGTYWQKGRVNAALAVATGSAVLTPSVSPSISISPSASPSPSIPFVCGGSPNSICNPSPSISPVISQNPSGPVISEPPVTNEPSLVPSVSPVPDNDCLDPRSTPERIRDWVNGFIKKIQDYIQGIMGNPQNPNRPAPPQPCIIR